MGFFQKKRVGFWWVLLLFFGCFCYLGPITSSLKIIMDVYLISEPNFKTVLF